MSKQLVFPLATRIFLITTILLGTRFVSSAQEETYLIPNSDTSLRYTLSGAPATATITGIQGSSITHLIVPETIEGVPVTAIADRAFDFSSAFTRVTIGNNVASIGDSAFYKSGITQVVIGSGLSSIGEKAFSGCSSLTTFTVDSGNPNYEAVDGILYNEALTELVDYPTGREGAYAIPGHVTSIANNAFWGCAGLNDITIHGSVTSIGAEAFSFCGMSSVSLPASVTSIGDGAFIGCPTLTTFNVDPGNPNYDTVDGVLYNISLTELVDYPAGLTGGFIIPDHVTSIGSGSFSWSRYLTSITIPDSVTVVSDSAFRICNDLTTVDIGSNVTSIGNAAFEMCRSLSSIILPDSVITIGDRAFGECLSMVSASIGNSVSTIGNSVFYRCQQLTSITIPDSVTSIGDAAFFNCRNLTNITIGNGVSSIGSTVFYGCPALTEIIVDPLNPDYASVDGVLYDKAITQLITCPGARTGTFNIPATVTSIGNGAFHQCDGLTAITIPNGVLTIGESAFFQCRGLTGITIPESVTSIGGSAFAYCATLSSIVVPESVTTIPDSLFYRCDNLVDASIGNSVTSIGTSAFNDCSSLTGFIIPGSVTSIGHRAFYSCDALTSIMIPESVSSIGDRAFTYCTGLTGIFVDPLNPNYSDLDGVLYNQTQTQLITCPGARTGTYIVPGSVTEISNHAFYYCTSLTSITVPDSVTQIGDYAFYRCHGLAGISLSENLTSIGDYAFAYCLSLTNVTIPNQVTTIGDSIFYQCSNLRIATLGNSVTSISDSAFYRCSSLDTVMIPNSVTHIWRFAFYQCDSLENIIIPNSVTLIGDSAFSACTMLTGITLPDSVTSIGDLAFYRSGLTSVALPASVTSLGERAFSSCPALTEILVDPLNPNYASLDGVLYNNPFTELITFPEGRTGAFTIPAGVTGIAGYAFYDCGGLTSIIFPDSVLSIGASAFNDCTSLTNVSLGNSTSSIGERAFYNCFLLTSITLPDSVTRIGDLAFYRCTNLTSATFEGDAVAEFGSSVFSNTAPEFTIYYYEGAAGFTYPTWQGYPTEMLVVPNADAGPDQTILETDGSGYESATLDGTGSNDPDGSIVSWEWTWEDGGTQVASGATASADFPLGTTLVTLTVTDNDGVTATDTVGITVATDSDNDGFSDNLEILLGTDPNNASDRVQAWLTHEDGSLPQLHYGPHSSNCEFIVEWTEDLGNQESWQVLTGLSFSGDSEKQSTDLPEAPSGKAFYRIQIKQSQN